MSDGDVSLSEAQFERLVGMLAENRVAFTQGLGALSTKLDEFKDASGKRYEELKAGIKLNQSTLDVIEGDLGKVQSTQREHTTALAEHTQSLEGLTELASTNFDMIESLNKHILGEAGTISHAPEIRGTRPQ